MTPNSPAEGLEVQSPLGVNSDSYKYPTTYETKEVVPRSQEDPYYATGQERSSGRIPWGLSPLVFAMLIALFTALIVGGAVGGGVTAALSSNNKECPASSNSSNSNDSGRVGNNSSASLTSTTTASTRTSSASSTASPTGTFANFIAPSAAQVESIFNTVCPSLDNTIVQSSATGSKFRISCNQSITGGFGINGTTLMEMIAYSFSDCANGCYLYNHWRGSTICTAVTWNNAMSKASLNGLSGNCWLFRDAAVFQTTDNSTSARLQMS